MPNPDPDPDTDSDTDSDTDRAGACCGAWLRLGADLDQGAAVGLAGEQSLEGLGELV